MCKISKTTVIAIFAGVILIWVVSWLGISQYFQCHEERGTFGDMFGAVNALFSGLAFAGLIITLLYQKEELKLQREELKQTRAELKGQKREFEIQNKTLKQQQFSTTFFQLLNAVQKNIDNLEIIFSNSYRARGLECFREANNVIKREIEDYRRYEISQSFSHEKASAIYKKIYEKSLYPMGVFFRSYYCLIKYIVTSELDDKEKYQYVSFARAQLSDDILSMLFYNLTIGYGTEKFKKLAEDWVLLNNIPENIYLFRTLKTCISENAFKRGGRYGEAEEMEKMHIEI